MAEQPSYNTEKEDEAVKQPQDSDASSQEPNAAHIPDPVDGAAVEAAVDADEVVIEPPTTETVAQEEADETEQMRQQLLRLQADFDNFRKRTQKEREDLQTFATRKLLADLLPVVDNFDRAMAALADAEGQVETLRAGLEMVHRQLLGLLDQYDVRPMAAEGEAFDPNVHEAVAQAPAQDGPVGVVVEVLQRGYWLGERVLRPAMVKVSV